MIIAHSPNPTLESPSEASPTTPLLDVRDLQITFDLPQGPVPAVQGVTFSVAAGETLAIVGESGSGKSVTARAIMGLLPPKTARISGSVRFTGTELIGLSNKEMRKHRGNSVAIVFQDPMRSLNPTMRIGDQLVEAVRTHLPLSKAEARDRVIDLLQRVRIPSAEQRFGEFPHQLSGGMRQRVMIAMALSCHPKLVIADEPTTALDVTTQAQIMELLAELQAEFQMAVILISHDMGLAATFTQKVAVMYSGRLVEQAGTAELFHHVRMPYTKALLDSIPRMDHPSLVPLPVINGLPPDPRATPHGCAFSPRCPFAREQCVEQRPPLVEGEPGHFWACWFPLSDLKGG
jgi:oligopeptide/dipeptide ABC transporter ATP-binding protein